MSYELSEMDRRMATQIQAGTVAEIDCATARCKVKVGEWVSGWMPWGSLGAGAVRHWRPPSVGEQALLLCPSGESSAGFVLPGFYSDQHQQANDNRPNLTAQDYPDGARTEYDHERHCLKAYLPPGGTVEITASGGLKITGDVELIGRLKSTGDVIAGGVSLIHHLTQDVTAGSAQSGPPVTSPS